MRCASNAQYLYHWVVFMYLDMQFIMCKLYVGPQKNAKHNIM